MRTMQQHLRVLTIQNHCDARGEWRASPRCLWQLQVPWEGSARYHLCHAQAGHALANVNLNPPAAGNLRALKMGWGRIKL